MAAKRKFKVKGINVELWDKSFRIDGMSNVFWPTHVTQEDVTQFINGIYCAIEERAVASGNKIVANKVLNLLKGKNNG